MYSCEVSRLTNFDKRNVTEIIISRLGKYDLDLMSSSFFSSYTPFISHVQQTGRWIICQCALYLTLFGCSTNVSRRLKIWSIQQNKNPQCLAWLDPTTAQCSVAVGHPGCHSLTHTHTYTHTRSGSPLFRCLDWSWSRRTGLATLHPFGTISTRDDLWLTERRGRNKLWGTPEDTKPGVLHKFLKRVVNLLQLRGCGLCLTVPKFRSNTKR